MKKQIVAGVLTIVILTAIKILLVLCDRKYLLFQYENGDVYTTLYLILDWVLNLASILGLYKLIRFVQEYDSSKVKVYQENLLKGIVYILVGVVAVLTIISLVYFV